MKKNLLILLLVTTSMVSSAQTYGNEWIDYSKTYYKIKVGATGLYRISQAQLATASLQTTPAQHFQLWKNGQQIALYTSVLTGTLSPTDYIGFWGESNDGSVDKDLYRYDSLQINDKFSLMTDTAAYFLTVNTVGSNKRFNTIPNGVTGNILPAETWFTYKFSKYYKERLNAGYAVDYGEPVYSASYETAEGWTSNRVFGAGISPAVSNPNMYVYNAGPAATLNATVSGNAAYGRTLSAKINGTTFASSYVSSYDIEKMSNGSIPLSAFTGDAASVQFSSDGPGPDAFVIGGFDIAYPRQFNFGGSNLFPFELPLSVVNKYYSIANFNSGGQLPELYDLTNNLRIVPDTVGGVVRFVLPPSITARKMLLISTVPANINSIAGMTARNFNNYGSPVNQGNYIIVSHPVLYNDGAGNNNVEKYRQYRSSAAGGNYNAKIIDIDQLTDQFGFGIKDNPLCIRNFAAYSLANFTQAPKFMFLIGHGLDYLNYRLYETDTMVPKLALIPTFGYPASDNLLTATREGFSATIPMGRLSAVSGTEVGRYLDKVKEFELAQASTVQTIGNKGWMKNVAQITGAIDDQSLYNLLTAYMGGYDQIISDSLFGGKVYNFSQNTGQYTAIGTNKSIDSIFISGMSLLTYFGHSSPNTLEFNLDNPYNYYNPGKYPLIIINGCATGNFFALDQLRMTLGNGTLSEKYLFADKRGSVGFIANTYLGLPQQIDYFTTEFYKNISTQMYGKSIGEMMQSTMAYLMDNYSYDYVARCHSEEITYHGDPALKLNPHEKPDYVIEDSLVTFNPAVISVADQSVMMNAKIINIGKSISDSLKIRVQQKLPDNSIITIGTRTIAATIYSDTINISMSLNPLLNKGNNEVIVTIDPANEIAELSETNNTVTKTFTVIEDEIRPVYPYNYSIVTDPALVLYGSTANPTIGMRNYYMQMDTSALFNSPSIITRTVSDSGGVIKFVPGIVFTDSTVYYWRLAEGPITGSTRWLNSSFVFINGGSPGFNQSHYYQYKDDAFDGMDINAGRKFQFKDVTRKLLIRAGFYPYYQSDQNNINLNSDQLEFWGCVFNNLQFYVLDSLTQQPWGNLTTSGSGRFKSWPVCANLGNPVRKFFEFPFTDQEYRKRAMNFFDSIPSGMYVAIRPLMATSNTTFINTWKADTAVFGSGISLWHKFHAMGLHMIDSFTSNRQYAFVFKKSGDTATNIRQFLAPTVLDQLQDTALLSGKDIQGDLTTGWFGPAKAWDRFKWDKLTNDDPTNQRYFEITGLDNDGNEAVLATVYNSTDTSISFIDADIYHYLKVRLHNYDAINAKPTQLKYLMLTGTLPPEGALSPNRHFVFTDTVNITDTLHFSVAFRNVSNVSFDSLKVNLKITNRDGNAFDYAPVGAIDSKLAPLPFGDSVLIAFNIPAATYGGTNQVMLDVNPANAQPEQFHFNNVLYRNFVVTQPLCPGSNIYFSSGYRNGSYSYQWQVDNGSGYTNLSNDAVYSNVNSDSIKLTSPPTSWYGNKYRCIITEGLNIYYSGEYILKFGMQWQGGVSTAWENPANWSCGSLPDQYTDVTIAGSLVRYPTVNANVACRSLAVSPGAAVTIATGANLTIKK